MSKGNKNEERLNGPAAKSSAVTPEQMEQRKGQLAQALQDNEMLPAQVEQRAAQAQFDVREQNAARFEQRKGQLAQVLQDNEMLPAQMEQRAAQAQFERRNAPKRITAEHISRATKTLEDYRKGKQNLEKRIVEHELWYRQQHWQQLRSPEKEHIPASGWLFNSLNNKHADMMDNIPECTCLAQEPSDQAAAETLTSILPVILENSDWERVYSDAAWQKIKTGTAVYGVFWNAKKQNGLGDVDIKVIDILNLFWEPGITDLQQSKNIFNVELCDNETLEAAYPQLKNKLGTPSVDVCHYFYDDTIDTSNKSAVVDWYWRESVNGKTILCYVKYVNDVVLYSSLDEDESGNGFYNHGMYPFVADALFPEVGTFCGFGFIDVTKDNAISIDKLNACIVKNAEQATMRRYFVKNDAAINIDEFRDWTKPFIHVTNSQLGQDNIMEYNSVLLSDIYVSVLQAKIDELKEVSSNRDFSQGGTASGVTSGAAISALQEAGSKVSRDILKGSYRAFAHVCKLIIELLRQFYSVPRYFRVTKNNGETQFEQFDNAALGAQPQQAVDGGDIGDRLPVFDIKVKAHKANPFSRAAQNQDAINFFSMGFFNPQVADQALVCLDMMDIEDKDKLKEKISQNGTMMQMIQQLQVTIAKMAQIIDRQNGTALSQGIAAEGMVQADFAQAPSKGAAVESKGDAPTVREAKKRTAAATQVR